MTSLTAAGEEWCTDINSLDGTHESAQMQQLLMLLRCHGVMRPEEICSQLIKSAEFCFAEAMNPEPLADPRQFVNTGVLHQSICADLDALLERALAMGWVTRIKAAL